MLVAQVTTLALVLFRGIECFNVIAFSTAINDIGHISFVNEANEWFPKAAAENNFTFRSTTDWSLLNKGVLDNYQVVIFLDTRPENAAQRLAFETYMKNGGSWLGFHFSAFALTPSDYPQNWNWYHKEFLGSDQYGSNTWKPTPAFLKVETKAHGATQNLPDVFLTAANEWYRWEGSLVNNPDIDILLSIDPSSFPLGTGPNPWEIWYSGYYPVVWSNKKYNMIYMNMGHNDIDYENDNAQASWTFRNEIQNRLVLDSIKWLAAGVNNKKRQ